MSENNFGEELGKLTPDLTLGATSEQIMRRGRRIRTIRQTSIVGAAAVAVLGITSIAALAGGGHHGTQTVQTGSGNGLGIALAPPSSPSSAPAASTTSAPPASTPVSSSPASPTSWYAASTPPAGSSLPASSSPSVSWLTRAAVDRRRPAGEPRRQRTTVGQPWCRAVQTSARENPCAVRNSTSMTRLFRAPTSA